MSGLLYINVDEFDNSFNKCVGQALFHALFAPGEVCGLLAHISLDRLGKIKQALGGIGPAVEQDIFHAGQELGFNFGINFQHARIDNSHVHAVGSCVVQKSGVHGFAHLVVSSEGERYVGYASADMRPWKVAADPFGGAEKIERVVGVFFHASGHREYIWVKYDVVLWKANDVY